MKSLGSNRAVRLLWQSVTGRNAALVVALVALLVLIASREPNYFQVDNLKAVLLQMSTLGILSVGTAYLILSGNVDLSIGSIFTLAAVEAATVSSHVGPWAAALVGILLAAGLGWINGALVWRVPVSPLIITLGTMTLYFGVALVITKGLGVSNVGDGFTMFGQGHLLGLPTPVVVMLVVAAIAQLILSRTPSGTTVYAIGGNREAAETVGIRVRRAVIGLFVINGAVVGLAAVLSASRFGGATAQVGVGLELDVITAVILGGVAWAGGEGRVTGVMLAVMLLTVVNSAIVTLGISPYYADVVKGGLLLIAVVMDQLASEQHARRRRLQAMHEAMGLDPDAEAAGVGPAVAAGGFGKGGEGR